MKDGFIRSQRELEGVTWRLGTLLESYVEVPIFLAIRSRVNRYGFCVRLHSAHQALPLRTNLQECRLYL